jgi:hypothetical protein
MKIANVIFEKELVNHTKVEYVNYYNEPIEYNTLDKSMPTLYVGWSFMKANNPDNSIIQNADILKKRIITNELYWECSFEESKASHVKGIDFFINHAPQFYFTPKYSYVNLDPVFFQLKDVQDIIDVIPKNIKASYNFKNEMIYLLFENKIFGLNLKMFEFFKFNIEEIVAQLSIRTETSFYDYEGTDYLKNYKIFPNFTLLKRYLVVILSK